MSRAPGTSRLLLPWITLAALLSGCQSAPVADVSISPTSSLLAVDILFPAPLSRDPSLVQVFFMRGPIHEGPDELPELIPASFVKWSRAYLLDPEPGNYSAVAVTTEYAPPLNYHPVDGVSDTVWSGSSSDATIFPAELIHRTTTAIGPGEVAFMGALRVRRGDQINADALPHSDLQKRIAERIRPSVTSQSGLRGWLARVRGVDLETTSLSNQPADRESFFQAALDDLGDSPWAAVIAREAASGESLVATPGTPAPSFESPVKSAVQSDTESAAQSLAPIPEAVTATPLPPVADPQPAPAEPEPSIATAARPEPKPVPLAPKPKRILEIPPDSPLAKIELGMHHDEVDRILGSPDGRIDRLTARAWIPFYDSPDANLREWIYQGKGRVVFSLYQGTLEVIDVVYDPGQEK